MRSLIISIIALGIFASAWGLFYVNTNSQLNSMCDQLEESVMPAIETEAWKDAYSEFNGQYEMWKKFRKHGLFFLDTQMINELDNAFAKTLMYIKAEDVSNSSGELLALKVQLTSLYQNEQLSLKNIF